MEPNSEDIPINQLLEGIEDNELRIPESSAEDLTVLHQITQFLQLLCRLWPVGPIWLLAYALKNCTMVFIIAHAHICSL